MTASPRLAPLLQVQGVTLQYKTEKHLVTATYRISFDVHQADRFVLLGPSGCGKSTLLKAVGGYMTPTEGGMHLKGLPIRAPGPDRVFVFQEFDQLLPWKTVKQNVMFALESSRKMRGKAAQAQAMRYIEKVNLAKFADAYPHTLSGGMKQRVAIVRALANQPRILLMDEPFGALDAQTRARMQAHLLEIWRKIDITIIFITHDLDEAIYLADRILVLKAHPNEVQELIEVPVPRPRNMGQCISKPFLATKARLEELIYSGPGEEQGEDLYPIVTRMTNVGDEVE